MKPHTMPRRITAHLECGLRINVLQWMPPQPPAGTLLLVHGLADSAWTWHGVASALAGRYEIYAFDLPGHGVSARAAAAQYAPARAARYLLELADLFALERPVLVGHSLGAQLALRVAAGADDRFAALVLVDYGLDLSEQSRERLLRTLRESDRRYADHGEYAAELRRRHPLADPALLDVAALGALAADGGGVRPAFDLAWLDVLFGGDAQAQPVQLAQLFGAISLPVTVVRGAWSLVLSQRAAETAARSCPNASLRVIARAGHSAQIDNPAALAAVLDEAARQADTDVATLHEDLAYR